MCCLNPYERLSDGLFYRDVFHFQMHVSNQSEISDHCCQFAFASVYINMTNHVVTAKVCEKQLTIDKSVKSSKTVMNLKTRKMRFSIL